MGMGYVYIYIYISPDTLVETKGQLCAPLFSFHLYEDHGTLERNACFGDVAGSGGNRAGLFRFPDRHFYPVLDTLR